MANEQARAQIHKQTDLVCLGEPLIELNQQADGHYLPGIGGDTSNCAIAAARQGSRVAYLSRIGDDTFGQQLQACWASEAIDASAVQVVPEAQTGVYFVSHGEDGHQFSYRRAGSAASQMTPSALDYKVIEQTSVLHLSGISLGISNSAADACFAAIEAARQAGKTVSFDPNYRPALWPLPRARALIHEAMMLCQIALPGLDDARLLTGLTSADEICDLYLTRGAQIVALTMGAEGVILATPDQRERVAPYPVQAVDATGAGDTFDGTFLAQWMLTGDPFASARYANVAAALSTQGFGAVTPIPLREQVERVLHHAGS
ncbi:MAG: sugar kinase [Burkholderiaceae bacterium]